MAKISCIPFSHSIARQTGALGKALMTLPLLLAVGNALGQAPTGFNKGFEESEPWKENAIQLPAAPKSEDLLEFEVGGNATMRFAVDAKSISVGNDGVVRYTLVSRSPSGAENVSYEGIRCESYEKKSYAFGQKDGSWSRSRRDQWEVITGTIANRQHATLARDYFCRHKIVEGKAEDIVNRLRYSQPMVDAPNR